MGPVTEENAKQIFEWVKKSNVVGGPWDTQTIEVERVVGPVFGVGHHIGNHYWLDTKSGDPPKYHWDGTVVSGGGSE
jgi:hypothetical protein